MKQKNGEIEVDGIMVVLDRENNVRYVYDEDTKQWCSPAKRVSKSRPDIVTDFKDILNPRDGLTHVYNGDEYEFDGKIWLNLSLADENMEKEFDEFNFDDLIVPPRSSLKSLFSLKAYARSIQEILDDILPLDDPEFYKTPQTRAKLDVIREILESMDYDIADLKNG